MTRASTTAALIAATAMTASVQANAPCDTHKFVDVRQSADVDGDGTIGVGDVAAIIHHWGTVRPAWRLVEARADIRTMIAGGCEDACASGLEHAADHAFDALLYAASPHGTAIGRSSIAANAMSIRASGSVRLDALPCSDDGIVEVVSTRIVVFDVRKPIDASLAIDVTDGEDPTTHVSLHGPGYAGGVKDGQLTTLGEGRWTLITRSYAQDAASGEPYEIETAASLAMSGPSQPADLDGDGMVGASDIVILLSRWD